jgi:hypothetical protein
MKQNCLKTTYVNLCVILINFFRKLWLKLCMYTSSMKSHSDIIKLPAYNVEWNGFVEGYCSLHTYVEGKRTLYIHTKVIL